MDGILIIDKPEGITSHDVVARCRRILRTKRIGHTGTLDPFATGVMVILVGQATRLAQFLDKDRKEYEALVRFGFETDTGDRTGTPKASAVPNSRFQIPDEEIEAVLKDFRGEILQTPPMYSAKKIAGKKLYELARKGIEVERKPVRITIYELELIETRRRGDAENQNGFEISDLKSETGENQITQTEDWAFRVLCSAGTYIRVLAEDIGKKLNVGAHLAELRRTRAGSFGIEKAVTLEKLEVIVSENRLEEVLIPMNEGVGHLPEMILDENELRYIKTGRRISARTSGAGVQKIRLTDGRGALIAIGEVVEKEIQPRIVF